MNLARHSNKQADLVYFAKPSKFISLQDVLKGLGRLLIYKIKKETE